MPLPQAPLKVEVTAEDQQRINTFSRLHAKMHELERLLKQHKVENQDSVCHAI